MLKYDPYHCLREQLSPKRRRVINMEKKQVFRAAFSAYVALSSIWAILTIVSFYGFSKDQQVKSLLIALSFLSFTLAWWAWLWGFKITITDSYLECRDGLYKRHRVKLEDIKVIKHGWVSVINFGKTITVPRIIIVPKDRKQPKIWINPKPFKGRDLRYLYALPANLKKKDEKVVTN